MKEIYNISRGMLESICELEKEIPRIELVASIHKVVHLPPQCVMFGPASEIWAYPLESALGSLKRILRNRAYPAASMFQRHLENESIRLIREFIGPVTEQPVECDKSKIKLKGIAKITRLSTLEINEIKRYIEENWAEFDALRDEIEADNPDELWSKCHNYLTAQQKSNYSGRKKFIIDFIYGTWYIYKKFTIFRTLFSVESLKSERDNSKVLFISKNRRLIGSIQQIIAVEVY